MPFATGRRIRGAAIPRVAYLSFLRSENDNDRQLRDTQLRVGEYILQRAHRKDTEEDKTTYEDPFP